jgi:hypothetical protein
MDLKGSVNASSSVLVVGGCRYVKKIQRRFREDSIASLGKIKICS